MSHSTAPNKGRVEETMKTLITLLAVAFLATAANIAYAGEPIEGIDTGNDWCHPITPGCAPDDAMKRQLGRGGASGTQASKHQPGTLTVTGNPGGTVPANGCNIGVRFNPTTGRCADGRQIDHPNAIDQRQTGVSTKHPSRAGDCPTCDGAMQQPSTTRKH